MSTSGSSKSLKVGIVGFGSFAKFLAETLIKQGHTLRATSRSDYSQLCAEMGITFFRDVGELLQTDNDVILLCTSILSLAQVLNSMPFHKMLRPSTLFVDVLSVKEYPRDLLLEMLPENADILCSHPMFGPQSGKNGWRDLTFVYEKVRIRNQTRCSNFLNIFEGQGCKMLEMSCEQHDKLAAKSQFLSHAIGRILSELDVKATPIDTKSFEGLVQLKENTIEDSFELFSGLFIHNKYARGELKNLELALGRVKQSLFGRMDESIVVNSDCTDHQTAIRNFSVVNVEHKNHQTEISPESEEITNLFSNTYQISGRNQNSKKKEQATTKMQLTIHQACTSSNERQLPRYSTRHAIGLSTSRCLISPVAFLPLKQTWFSCRQI